MSLFEKLIRAPFLVRHTWQIEAAVVGAGLLGVLLFTYKNWYEFIGAIAVMATFMHGQVADRLAWSQQKRESRDVPCYKWLFRYYLTKEIAWFCYFVLLHAWSALFGAILFLIDPLWRNVYHRYHPKDD